MLLLIDSVLNSCHFTWTQVSLNTQSFDSNCTYGLPLTNPCILHWLLLYLLCHFMFLTCPLRYMYLQIHKRTKLTAIAKNSLVNLLAIQLFSYVYAWPCLHLMFWANYALFSLHASQPVFIPFATSFWVWIQSLSW